MRVKVERNDWLNEQMLRVVRLHADADTQENTAAFHLTPTQAALVWWAMRRLESAIRDSAGWVHEWDSLHEATWSDNMRCHADAAEWSREFRHKLEAHAKAHDLEVMRCR